MPLALDLKQLGSTLIRSSSTTGEISRIIAGPLNQDGKPNFIQQAINLGEKLVAPVLMKLNEWGARVSGSLLKTLASWGWSALSWVLGQVPSFFMGTWRFNWNATDEELDAPWANFVNTLAGQLGGTVGNMGGWIVCGAIPGLFMLKFNKLLALRVLKEVGEEALEELTSNLWLLVNTIAKGLLRAAAVNLYKGTRRAIKKLVSGDSDWAKGFAMLAGPKAVESIKKWGEKGSKPWSFAIKQEEFIESFDAAPVQNFVEELIEEFQDSCTEAWYVVANATDEWIQQQRFAKEVIHGELDVLEIYPDRENEEEKIILAGPQELLKPVIVNTITNYQLIENRNIGNFFGETITELSQREYRHLMARIAFSSQETAKADITTITLYNVNKSKLNDWDEVKQACGGANGYMWGPWKVTGTMDDETYIKIWAASESEGVDRVEALAKLVNGNIDTINAVHELKEGKRKVYDSLYKKARRQYPYELLIINPVQILNEENGKTTKKGVYKDRKAILPLYTSSKPDDWSQALTDLFATPGPDEL